MKVKQGKQIINKLNYPLQKTKNWLNKNDIDNTIDEFN